MHDTYTILLTWYHILLRKVHMKFQCQRANGSGENVEQALKKAKFTNFTLIMRIFN